MAQTQMTVIPKVDSKGRKFYTPEQVKQMADERGLPARLVGGYSVMPLSTVEALGVVRDWRRYYPHEYPKPRRVYCGDRYRGCGASLTSVDLELGHCSQCGEPLVVPEFPLEHALLLSLSALASEREEVANAAYWRARSRKVRSAQRSACETR